MTGPTRSRLSPPQGVSAKIDTGDAGSQRLKVPHVFKGLTGHHKFPFLSSLQRTPPAFALAPTVATGPRSTTSESPDLCHAPLQPPELPPTGALLLRSEKAFSGALWCPFPSNGSWSRAPPGPRRLGLGCTRGRLRPAEEQWQRAPGAGRKAKAAGAQKLPFYHGTP